MATHVVIVGGGPVGLVAAILLGQRGYRVEVLESRPDPRKEGPSFPGRSINLTLAERGWEAFRRAGIEDAVAEIAVPVSGRMIHGEDGALRFHQYTPAGDVLFSVSRRRLSALLVELASAIPAVTVRFEHQVLGLDLRQRVLRMALPDGRPAAIDACRVLAADGSHSIVRRSFFDQSSVRFDHRLSPISYRELLLPPRNDGKPALPAHALHLWPRGRSMIVAFPNLDSSFTVCLFMPTYGETSFASLRSPADVRAFFLAAGEELANAIPGLEGAFFSGPPAPLASSWCEPLAYGGWLALLGDAARTVVPFLGQGLNAGLEDCTILHAALERTRDDWSGAVTEYDVARREDSRAVVELAEQHFEELAVAAREPGFVVRKALEEKAHSLAPERFVPLYTMVAFQPHAYSVIREVRARQEALLNKMMRLPDICMRWDSDEVQRELETELSKLDPIDQPRRPHSELPTTPMAPEVREELSTGS